jgi:hypothetical protein
MHEEKKTLAGLFRDDPETPEGKYLVKRRDGTVPEWPSFVLGARDRTAAWALWFYGWIGPLFGLSWSYCKSCRRESWRWTRYRREHGNGDPDKGRHRKDDPETVAQMRKGRSA